MEFAGAGYLRPPLLLEVEAATGATFGATSGAELVDLSPAVVLPIARELSLL